MSKTNEVSKRERKMDVEKLNLEQVDTLSEQIGEKLRAIVDEACAQANKICNIYGMEAKMMFALEPKQPAQKEQTETKE